jgi:hypothetical protein
VPGLLSATRKYALNPFYQQTRKGIFLFSEIYFLIGSGLCGLPF